MKVVSKESVTRVLGSIEEYKQVACVESKGLDVISLLIRLCHLQSKKISEDDRQVLVDHIKNLISEELVFAQKMELEEAEAILMDSVSPLCNPAQSK
ncbi:conserved hypothetical protein [Vibrio chagasii]|nr:conserved hypothetical protein [Vibrio chagasii]